MVQLVMEVQPPGPILDFACGTGVLTSVVWAHTGEEVYGMDGNLARVRAAQAAFGPRHLFRHLPIRGDTIWPDGSSRYGAAVRWVKHLQVQTVLMRRAIADVFEKQPELVGEFTRQLCDAGVTHLIVEGRVEVAKATNPFPTIGHEVDALRPWYREVERRGRLSHLEAT